MASKTKRSQFVRAWRKYRGLSQEDLAARIGIARSYVSLIERGQRRYDQHFLEAAAVVLDCAPADLIGRDPSASDALWSVWKRIPEKKKTLALEFLKLLAHS